MYSRIRGRSSSYALLLLAALILFAHAASVYADNPSQGPYEAPPKGTQTEKKGTEKSDDTVKSDGKGKNETEAKGCTDEAMKDAKKKAECEKKPPGKVIARDKDGNEVTICVKGDDCKAKLAEMESIIKGGGKAYVSEGGKLTPVNEWGEARRAELLTGNDLSELDKAFMTDLEERGKELADFQAKADDIAALTGRRLDIEVSMDEKGIQGIERLEKAFEEGTGYRFDDADKMSTRLRENARRLTPSEGGGDWDMANTWANLTNWVGSFGQGGVPLPDGGTFSFENNQPVFTVPRASAGSLMSAVNEVQALNTGNLPNLQPTSFASMNPFLQGQNPYASLQPPQSPTFQSLAGLQQTAPQGTTPVSVIGADGKQLVWNPFTGRFEPLVDASQLPPAIDPKLISFTPVSDVTAAQIEQAFAELDSGQKTFQELADVAAFPIAPSEPTNVPGTVLTNLTPEERAAVLPTFGQAVSAWSEGKIDNVEFARQIGQNLAQSSRAFFQRFGFAQVLPDGTLLSAPDAEGGIAYRGIQGEDVNPISSAHAGQMRGAVPILIHDRSAASTLAKEVVYADANVRGADGKTLGQLFAEKGGAPLTLADIQGKGYAVAYFEAVHPTDATQTVGRDIDGRKDLGLIVETMRTAEGQSAGETVRSLVFYEGQPQSINKTDSGLSVGINDASAAPTQEVPLASVAEGGSSAGTSLAAPSEGLKPLAATIQELWKDIASAEPPKGALPAVPGTIVDGENAGQIPSLGKQVADAAKAALSGLNQLNPFAISDANAAQGAKTRFGIKALDAAPDNWVSKNLRDILAPQGCSARDHSCYTSPTADAEAYFSKLIGQPEYKDGCQPLTVRCIIVGKWVSDDSAWRAKVGARAVQINPEGHANDVARTMREQGVDVTIDTGLDLGDQSTRLALAKAMSKREGAEPYADNILEEGYKRAVARFGGAMPERTLSGGENDILYRSLTGRDLAAAERNGIDAVAQRLRDMGYNVEVVERKGVYRTTRPGEERPAPLDGIVTHSTGDKDNSAELYVREPQNRGLFKTAYQAGIDCDERSCKITLARSEDKYPTATRDNHVSFTSSRRPDAPNPDLNNWNTIGVALPGAAGRELMDSERKASADLARELSQEFGITRVTAHGVEDYKDLPGQEGVAMRDAMRAAIAGDGGDTRAPAVARLPGGAPASSGGTSASGRAGSDRPILYDIASYNWDKFTDVFQDPAKAARLAFGFDGGEGKGPTPEGPTSVVTYPHWGNEGGQSSGTVTNEILTRLPAGTEISIPHTASFSEAQRILDNCKGCVVKFYMESNPNERNDAGYGMSIPSRIAQAAKLADDLTGAGYGDRVRRSIEPDAARDYFDAGNNGVAVEHAKLIKAAGFEYEAKSLSATQIEQLQREAGVTVRTAVFEDPKNPAYARSLEESIASGRPTTVILKGVPTPGYPSPDTREEALALAERHKDASNLTVVYTPAGGTPELVKVGEGGVSRGTSGAPGVLQEGLSYDKPQTPQQVASRVGLFQDGGLLWEVARETVRNGFESIVEDINSGDLNFDRFAMEGAGTRVVFDDNPTGQLVTVDTRGGVQARSRYVDAATAQLQDQVDQLVRSGALPENTVIVMPGTPLQGPPAKVGDGSLQALRANAGYDAGSLSELAQKPTIITPDGTQYTVEQLQGQNPSFQNYGQKLLGSSEKVSDVVQNACAAVGVDCRFTSGYRDSDNNRRVGGASGSRHLVGDALDVKVPSGKGLEFVQAVRASLCTANDCQGGIGYYGVNDRGEAVFHVDTRSGRSGWGPNYSSSGIPSGAIGDEVRSHIGGAKVEPLAAAPVATLVSNDGGANVALPSSNAKPYTEILQVTYGPPTPESQGTAVQRIDTIARVDPSVPVNQITRFDPNTGRIYTIPASAATPETKTGPSAPWSPSGGNGPGSGPGAGGASPFAQIAQSLGNMFGGGQGGGQSGGQGGGKGGSQGRAPSGGTSPAGGSVAPATVAPAMAVATPAILKFSCEPNAFLKEGITTVAWACGNSGTSKGTGFDTRGLPSGSVQIPVATTTTFNLACYAQGALVAERQCTVALLKPKVVIVAVPSSVEKGGTVRIGWITSQTKNCSFYGPGTVLQGGGPHGTMEVKNLEASTRFKLACGTAAGVFETPLIVEVKGYSGPIVDAEVPAEGAPAVSSARSATQNSETTADGGTTSRGATSNTASTSTSQEGKFTATDASGNAVSLCDPAVGLFKFTQCLLGN